MSQPATALICALAGFPVGWLAWRWAQIFIDARSLEKGDTEVRLPAPTAIAFNVVMFGALGWRFAREPIDVLLVYLIEFAFLMVLLLVDFGRYYLPNRLIAASLLVGIAGVTASNAIQGTLGSVWYPLAGVVINFAVYFLFWFIAVLAFGDRGLGFGDVKLASVLGLLLGWLVVEVRLVWVLVFWAVFIGFLSGALVSIILLKGVKLKAAFPQGPFLVLGTLVVIVSSSQILGY
ncbi:MAG: prepilin peptidase [Actinobacteria bacterium]|nr:prepilin peptidase [Actinomycetota bacterium]